MKNRRGIAKAKAQHKALVVLRQEVLRLHVENERLQRERDDALFVLTESLKEKGCPEWLLKLAPLQDELANALHYGRCYCLKGMRDSTLCPACKLQKIVGPPKPLFFCIDSASYKDWGRGTRFDASSLTWQNILEAVNVPRELLQPTQGPYDQAVESLAAVGRLADAVPDEPPSDRSTDSNYDDDGR